MIGFINNYEIIGTILVPGWKTTHLWCFFAGRGQGNGGDD